MLAAGVGSDNILPCQRSHSPQVTCSANLITCVSALSPPVLPCSTGVLVNWTHIWKYWRTIGVSRLANGEAGMSVGWIHNGTTRRCWLFFTRVRRRSARCAEGARLRCHEELGPTRSRVLRKTPTAHPGNRLSCRPCPWRGCCLGRWEGNPSLLGSRTAPGSPANNQPCNVNKGLNNTLLYQMCYSYTL